MTKNVKIHNDTRLMLRSHRADKESVDKTINRLLDDLESDFDDVSNKYYGFTNIELSEDTMARIKSYGVSDKESYDSILKRVLYYYADK